MPAATRFDPAAQYRGDTFAGVDFTINVDGSPLDLTGATIRAQFRDSKTKALGLEINTTTSGITITDAAAGQFSFDAFSITLEPGRYNYDVQIEVSGTVRTYIYGVFDVLEDVTT